MKVLYYNLNLHVRGNGLMSYDIVVQDFCYLNNCSICEMFEVIQQLKVFLECSSSVIVCFVCIVRIIGMEGIEYVDFLKLNKDERDHEDIIIFDETKKEQELEEVC